MNPKRIRLDPLSKAEISKSLSENRSLSVFHSPGWKKETERPPAGIAKASLPVTASYRGEAMRATDPNE